MKRILKKMLLASVAIMMAFTGATAQVDLQQSFGIMCDSEDDFMFAEGGNWKITFATPPHFAQVVSKYSRGALPAFFFASRQALQLLGLFIKPFSL